MIKCNCVKQSSRSCIKSEPIYPLLLLKEYEAARSSPPILTNPQIFGDKTCLLATRLFVSVEIAYEADDESLGVGDEEDVEDVGDMKMLTSKECANV